MDHMDEAVNIIASRAGKIPRAKLLQFHDNQRPAYWGTWTKQSQSVTGRRPFGQTAEFDYEYDSDDDWEDEGEGESLSDAEDEKEEEDDYEVDNEFFVPHGYLSDGEEDKDEDEVFNPEKEKEQLKPRLWGCYWESEELDTGVAAAQLVRILKGYSAIPCCNNNVPIATSFSQPADSPDATIKEDGSESVKTKSAKTSKVAKTFPEVALPDLVRLVHINPNNKIFLAKEFTQFWHKKTDEESQEEKIPAAAESVPPTAPPSSASESTPSTAVAQHHLLSKRKVVEQIQEIAVYKKLDNKLDRFWVVKPEILDKLGLALGDTNTWNYILEQPNMTKHAQQTSAEESATATVPPTSSSSRPGSPTTTNKNGAAVSSLITKFTKVLTEEERAKNLATPPSAKRPKLAGVATTPTGEGGSMAVNMIATKKPPSSSVNMIATKKTPSSSVNMIATKKTPSFSVNMIATKKTPGQNSRITSIDQVD